MQGTKADILAALRWAFPDWEFGIREPVERQYVAPATFWKRVRQLLFGPQSRVRVGEVEIAVLVPALPVGMCDAVKLSAVIDDARPCGVVVLPVFYQR